jgi:hypothetical protein
MSNIGQINGKTEKARMPQITGKERVALEAEGVMAAYGIDPQASPEAIRAAFNRREAFSGRGFSKRIIEALVAIDAPERLLFMTEKQVKSIPGIGKASIAEIMAYRAKFIR